MYRLLKDAATGEINPNVVLRTSDGVYIPLAEGNTDYEAYKAWLAEGNTPEAA
jgi:hypothetical protein